MPAIANTAPPLSSMTKSSISPMSSPSALTRFLPIRSLAICCRSWSLKLTAPSLGASTLPVASAAGSSALGAAACAALSASAADGSAWSPSAVMPALMPESWLRS